jgi:hypothetical protein
MYVPPTHLRRSSFDPVRPGRRFHIPPTAEIPFSLALILIPSFRRKKKESFSLMAISPFDKNPRSTNPLLFSSPPSPSYPFCQKPLSTKTPSVLRGVHCACLRMHPAGFCQEKSPAWQLPYRTNRSTGQATTTLRTVRDRDIGAGLGNGVDYTVIVECPIPPDTTCNRWHGPVYCFGLPSSMWVSAYHRVPSARGNNSCSPIPLITQPGPGANRRAFRGRFRIIMYPVPVPASAIPHPPEAIHRTVNSTGTFDNSEIYTPDFQNNIQIAITIHLCQFL